jgi:ABC-type sugar transport system ATPase subunit
VGLAIMGIDPKDSGRIFLNDKEIKISRPEDAIARKIAYLTEDRRARAYYGHADRDNVVAPSLKRFISHFDILNSRHRSICKRWVESTSIITPSIFKKVLTYPE